MNFTQVAPPPTRTADATVFTKPELLNLIGGSMPPVMINLVVGACLGHEFNMLVMPVGEVPATHHNSTLPAPTAGQVMVPAVPPALLPNYAGNPLYALQLMEDVRARYPQFRYRIAVDRVQTPQGIMVGHLIESGCADANGMLSLQQQAVGNNLPMMAVHLALEFLLDQPGNLERVSFHMPPPRAADAPAPRPTLQ